MGLRSTQYVRTARWSPVVTAMMSHGCQDNVIAVSTAVFSIYTPLVPIPGSLPSSINNLF